MNGGSQSTLLPQLDAPSMVGSHRVTQVYFDIFPIHPSHASRLTLPAQHVVLVEEEDHVVWWLSEVVSFVFHPVTCRGWYSNIIVVPSVDKENLVRTHCLHIARMRMRCRLLPLLTLAPWKVVCDLDRQHWESHWNRRSRCSSKAP